VGLLKDVDEYLVLVSTWLDNADLACGEPFGVQLEYAGSLVI